MSSQNDALRRRAALAVLSPILPQEALMDALWLQQESMHSDAVSEIISYIDAVAARHLLDASTCKRLYEALYRALREPADTLPRDPWPTMQAGRTTQPPLAAPTTPTAAASAPPAAPAPAAALAHAVPPGTALSRETPPRAAHEVVFTGLVQAILSTVRQFHTDAQNDLRQEGLAHLERISLPINLRQKVRSAWGSEDANAWRIAAPAETLATLVHTVYVSLCETLGPVEADHVLMHAVRQAEQLPQAAEYSPKRFL